MSDQAQGPGWYQAADGKWYPPQQQQYPPPPPGYVTQRQARRSGGCLKAIGVATIVFVALVVIVIIAAVATSSKKTSTTSSSGGTPAAPHAVGETAQTADFAVTLNSAQDPYVDPQTSPPAGEHFVAVDVTIHNTSSKDLVVSSIVFFDLTAADGTVQKETIGPALAPIDGTVAANDVRRGFVIFDVADTATKPLKLRVKGDITAGGVTYTIP